MSARPTHVDTSRALYLASRRFGHRHHLNSDYAPGVVYRAHGRVVTMARSFAPCAVSHHGTGRSRHATRAVFLAWRGGRLVGTLVVAWCGVKLVTADLVDSDMGGHTECRLCEVRTTRPAAQVEVRVLVTAGAVA